MAERARSDLTVGVLGTHNSKETKAILNAIEALGYESAWLRAENTAISIEGGELRLEPDVDVVVNRMLLSNAAYPAEGIGLTRTLAQLRPMLNPPGPVTTALHKIATAVTLVDAGVPVPDALFALSNDRLNLGRERFGDRAVYKTAIGTHGGGAWIVDSSAPINPRVHDRQTFLQQLIETGEVARDSRVYLVGDRVIGAMNRSAKAGEWRTNVSLGGSVADGTADLPERAVEIARDAKAALGLDYAGVDLISDDGDWYVLEVNPTAGFRGFFAATGVSPAPAIARLAIERAGGTVSDDAVAELATTLDDSVPTCKPKPPAHAGDRSVLGYTERVRVVGTMESRVVTAKSDTGARRTSVDLELAAELGTGSIQETVSVRSGSSKQSTSRPIVDIVIAIDGRTHAVEANVQDRSHMSYPVLLGRDILEHYHVDVTRETTAEADETETADADKPSEE